MKDTRNTVVAAVVLGIGIGFAGFFVRDGIVRFKKFEQRVEVRGLAERIVDSNEASWDISFSAAANDMVELNQKVQATQKAIHDFLKSKGIAEEEIVKQPVQVSDRLSQEYGNGKGQRFIARSQFSISSKEVAKLTEASQKTDELVHAGVILTNSTVHYYFTALNGIKPAMLEEATRNARDAATKFAEMAGARVGKIRNATQGLFTIGSPYSDYDNRESMKKKVRVVSQVDFFLE